MTARSPDHVAADYDDAPGRATGISISRLLCLAGALLTVLMAVSIASLLVLGIDVSLDVYAVCAVFSMASLPVIMLVWSEEVAWQGGWSGGVVIVVISVLTWLAEVLLAVFILGVGWALAGM